jgi:ribosomal protein S6
MDVEQADEETSAEPRVYELAFHLDPELSESDAKKAYDGIRSVITENGTLVAEGEPEKIQLAYTVSRTETAGRRDFDASFFSWIAYEANGEGHDAILTAARAEKRIFRFLDVKTTKEAAKHSAEMQELRKQAPEAQQEEVSDATLDAAIEEATV